MLPGLADEDLNKIKEASKELRILNSRIRTCLDKKKQFASNTDTTKNLDAALKYYLSERSKKREGYRPLRDKISSAVGQYTQESNLCEGFFRKLRGRIEVEREPDSDSEEIKIMTKDADMYENRFNEINSKIKELRDEEKDIFDDPDDTRQQRKGAGDSADYKY